MVKRMLSIVVVIILLSSYMVENVKAMAVSTTYDETFYSGNSILFYDPRCESNQAAGYITLSGKDNLEKILTFFMQKGLTLAQATGIAGNFMVESRLDPTIIQGGNHAKPGTNFSPTPGVGFGLAQWTTGGRQQALMTETRRLGVDITDLGGQLSFAWKELSESYGSTLTALKATSDPVDAAVVFHDGYERSADTQAAVVSNRGGNATKFYSAYSDAPALAGSTSDIQPLASTTDSTVGSTRGGDGEGSCVAPGYGNGDLQQMVTQYAWSRYIRGSTRDLPEALGQVIKAADQKPEYAAAVARALSEGRYVGGIAVKGDDCGGFVTTLIYDSGFDKAYNSNARGGYTVNQEAWLRKNWQQISATDASDRQPGDVAINAQHTYIYVGEIPGFGSKIASASVSGPVRAPMAGHEGVTDSSFRWYRKKVNL